MERLNTQLGAENLKIAKETRRDNIIMLAIAKQGAQDSRTMRGIGWVTMAFLPATFVTSFFGMNFFEALENGANRPPFFKESGKNVWVFFSIAGPLTVISLVWFFLWDRKEAEKQEKILDGLLADIGDGNASGAQADDRKILVQKA
ncbi:hypothetical protein CC86DRAFT_381353 [Ophiobolus disseminans]|uniref:Uncharacterized protein n=1 Tax=Ophiobolus disseminans TaxID=1469910 RepID=A0A6A7A3N2_9PLEO|nr:hypothetical protein CC86DRAFT_381353 [Ophiobolus disseminans]